MKKNLQPVATANNSNGANTENLKTFSNNLPEVEVIDETQTKGKVSENVSLTETAEKESKEESLKKNEVFAEVQKYFCPLFFDETAQREYLKNIPSSILSDYAKEKAIQQSKKEFFDLHKEELEQAEKLSFADVSEKLKSNPELYKKVLSVCGVSELRQERYIKDGKVLIYRGAQFTDKDGTNRYIESEISRTENGHVFTEKFWKEEREISTSNILLSIRFYSTYLDTLKRVSNKVSDYKRLLQNVSETAKRAKENGFTKEQIFAEIEKVFNS